MVEINIEKENIFNYVKLLPLTVANHMYHVGLLTSILTEKILQIDSSRIRYREAELSYYGKAAFFHDIGKAFVPINLLIKSDKFTAEEMEVMKNHTLCAQVLFNDIQNGYLTRMPEQLFRLASEAAKYHHEWWNGKGYPYGISGEDIPLIARITSVCDAYDAITSTRYYNSARTHCEACGELETFSGTQFDPKLVQLFLNNHAEFSDLIRINRGYIQGL